MPAIRSRSKERERKKKARKKMSDEQLEIIWVKKNRYMKEKRNKASQKEKEEECFKPKKE